MSNDKTLLTLAEEFYEANTKVVDDLVAELRAAGVTEEALDGLIHDGAEEEKRDSEEASSVNNHGLTFQVASIMEGNSIREGERIIREAAGLSSAPKV